MPQVAQPRLTATGLLVQPRIGIGRGLMRSIPAPLPAKAHRRVALSPRRRIGITRVPSPFSTRRRVPGTHRRADAPAPSQVVRAHGAGDGTHPTPAAAACTERAGAARPLSLHRPRSRQWCGRRSFPVRWPVLWTTSRPVSRTCACQSPTAQSGRRVAVRPRAGKGTLADSVRRLVALFKPLVAAILVHQNEAAVRHGDETTWRVQALRELASRLRREHQVLELHVRNTCLYLGF